MTPRPAPSAAATGWDDAQSARWLSQLELREAPLVPVLEPLLTRAALQPGERVLDVGCGAGPTTVAAARLVGVGGAVTGVDVSAAMVGAARDRAGAELGDADAAVDWLVADAARHPFPPACYDVVLSRFGVMFFDDPAAAFANLATACRPDGRLALAVWARRSRSEFFTRPLDVVTRVAERLGLTVAPPSEDQGPFSLGDPDELTELLQAVGWTAVEVELDQRPLPLGGAGGDDERAVEFVLALGSSRAVLEDQPAEVHDAVRAELLAACRDWCSAGGAGLPGGFLVVRARRDGAGPDLAGSVSR